MKCEKQRKIKGFGDFALITFDYFWEKSNQSEKITTKDEQKEGSSCAYGAY